MAPKYALGIFATYIASCVASAFVPVSDAPVRIVADILSVVVVTVLLARAGCDYPATRRAYLAKMPRP